MAEKPIPDADDKPTGWREWLRRAFAIEKYDESSLSGEDKEILEKLAGRIAEKRMTAAAILWIESHRHLNFIGSQVLVAASPVLDLMDPLVSPILRRFGMYIPLDELPRLQSALEKRYSIEYFLQQLEALAAKDYNSQPAEDETDSTEHENEADSTGQSP